MVVNFRYTGKIKQVNPDPKSSLKLNPKLLASTYLHTIHSYFLSRKQDTHCAYLHLIQLLPLCDGVSEWFIQLLRTCCFIPDDARLHRFKLG